jgi:hypothetical protein
MAGEGGTTARGVPIQPMMNKPGQRDLPSPLWGLGFGLLWRPQSKAPPFGRGFLLPRILETLGARTACLPFCASLSPRHRTEHTWWLSAAPMALFIPRLTRALTGP